MPCSEALVSSGGGSSGRRASLGYLRELTPGVMTFYSWRVLSSPTRQGAV